MKAEELAVIKERTEKATAGPWKWDASDEIMKSEKTDDNVISAGACQNYGYVYLDESDVQFIANAREDVPKLVAEVERLQSEKAMLLNALQSINAVCEAVPEVDIRQNRDLLIIDEIAFDILNGVDDE